MGRPPTKRPSDQPQNDPDVTNDPPHSDRGDYLPHVFSQINQVFERMGKIDQKIDQISSDQKDLKASVEKHEKIVNRVVFGFLGGAALAAAIWFVYVNFVKDNFTIKLKTDTEEVAKAGDGAAK